jgi:hypothetical protein
MKTVLFAVGLFLLSGIAQAQQTGAISGSQSSSMANASPHQSQTAGAQSALTYAPVTNVPANTHSSQHVSGVSPDLMVGGYASSAAQDNCDSTSQVGAAAFGAAIVAGHGHGDQQCYNLRSADYRDRLAFALEALAKNHPGFEGQAINGELAEIHEMNVDVCRAERRLSDAQCDAWATEHTPTASELRAAH